MRIGSIELKNVKADTMCPTWKYSYLGWRKILAEFVIRIPRVHVDFYRWYPVRRYIRQEKERVFYKIGDTTICSFENYVFLEKNCAKE